MNKRGGVIFTALLIGFVVYATMRGTLSQYFALLFKSAAPQKPQGQSYTAPDGSRYYSPDGQPAPFYLPPNQMPDTFPPEALNRSYSIFQGATV